MVYLEICDAFAS